MRKKFVQIGSILVNLILLMNWCGAAESRAANVAMSIQIRIHFADINRVFGRNTGLIDCRAGCNIFVVGKW